MKKNGVPFSDTYHAKKNTLFLWVMSQADALARISGECREGQISRSPEQFKFDAPLSAAGYLPCKRFLKIINSSTGGSGRLKGNMGAGKMMRATERRGGKAVRGRRKTGRQSGERQQKDGSAER